MKVSSRPRASGSAFAGFRFPAEVIVLAVRWYLRYGLSYRDVEELLLERGVEVDLSVLPLPVAEPDLTVGPVLLSEAALLAVWSTSGGTHRIVGGDWAMRVCCIGRSVGRGRLDL